LYRDSRIDWHCSERRNAGACGGFASVLPSIAGRPMRSTGPWQQYFKLSVAALPSARGLLPLVVLLGGWQLLQTATSPSFPTPSDWWNGLMLLSKSGRLYPALSATTITLLLGLALAIAVGTGVGLFVGVFPRLRRAIGPLLEFLRAIPPPAIVPV